MGRKTLKNSLRKTAFRILRYSGIAAFFREVVQGNRVNILLFHNISPETAEQSFNYLTKKYRFISLRKFLEIKKDPSKSFPGKAAVATFDDGYKENAELLPVFKKYGIEPAIFLCASMIGTHRHFWFEENYSNISVKKLKNMANGKKLEILRQGGFSIEKEYEISQVLNRDDIRKMYDTTDFQSHTNTHPCLPQCPEVVSREEIVQSKQILEKEFGLNIYALAYPNGDYSKRDIALAKDAGYQCALTVDFGFNSKKTDPFRLKRICVNDATDLNELVVKASGAWDFFKTINGLKQATGLKKPVN
jgi:peptidoglycan/xylan/chitin deacetylase (PgdA/CDA1 family)